MASRRARLGVCCSSCSIWRAYWRLSVWARRAHTAGPRLALSTRFCRAVASASRPITPPRASTSCTSWLLAGPPTAGLQGCQAMRSRLRLKRAVDNPSRAAARAASQPACPPPTTIRSKDSLAVLGALIGGEEVARSGLADGGPKGATDGWGAGTWPADTAPPDPLRRNG